MWYFKTVLSGLFILFGKFQQREDWKLIWKIPVNADQIESDNLGNVFVVKDDQLIKYRENGTIFRQYSNKTLGKISSLDVRNPLKIIVFYKDFSRLIFLDNTITENGSPVFLDEYGLEFAGLVCASYDNGFWIFDPVQYRLLRFDQNMKNTTRIINLNQIIEKKISPTYMIERENHLFITDPESGILRFDIFGNYINTIPLKNLRKFNVIDKNLIYMDSEGYLVFYDLKLLNFKKIKLPETHIRDLHYYRNSLWILTQDAICLYRLSE